MSHKLLIATAAVLSAVSAHAGISITTTTFTYSQDFNTLATTGSTAWTNDVTLAGWSLFRSTGASLNPAAGTGSSNAGGFYSFGTANSTDRALGSVASGGTSTMSYVLSLTNNSGTALNSFTLRFDGEQWRTGGPTMANGVSVPSTEQFLKLEYGFGDSLATAAWVSPGAGFDFHSPLFGVPASAVNGNVLAADGGGLVANLGGTVATNWASGSTLWIRWTDIDNAGNDHGLAIDNVRFSVTAVPEPSTYAMLLAGLGAVGFMARRRRG